MEIDENGNEVDNSNINLQKSLIDIGIRGYAIDSLYTEFIFTTGKNPRISGFKKGIAQYESNGTLKSITFNNNNANLNYGENLSYIFNGLKSEIVFGSNGLFVKEKYNRYSDGRIHSVIYYRYDHKGYLNYVILERPGEEKITIYYTYPNENGGLTIREGNNTYNISLTANKLENQGFVCNVFSHANAPLTNQYVINPDLYYFGLYGVPIKYLPDVFIQNGTTTENGVKKNVIIKIDDYQFFYK